VTRALRFGRFLFFLTICGLLIAIVVRIFMPTLAQPSAAAFIQWQPVSLPPAQSDQGGGNGTMTPRAGGIIYGAGGPGGTCKGTAGSIAHMLNMDFGWTTQYLDSKWAKDTRDELCNDHWLWTITQTLPAKTVFTMLQWIDSKGQPLNLLAAPYANQPITVRPIAQVDPTTWQQQQQQQQQDTQPGQVHIDVCAPLRLLLQAGAWAVSHLYQATAKQINFLWTTPLQPFQDNAGGGLISVWNTSWAIVLACITAIVAWAALRYMVGAALSWLAYANLIELLPRVLFALLAAFYSKQFFIVFIQMNNALAHIFNASALTIMLNQQKGGIIDSTIQILYGVMAFVLLLEEIARIAVIYLLFAFSPVLFFLASLRETQRFAKTTAIAAILFIFLQAMQAAALDVGGQVLTTVLHNKPNNLSFLNLLVSLTIMYITIMLFFGITRVALGRAGDPIASLPFIVAAASARFGRGAARTTRTAISEADKAMQRGFQPLWHWFASGKGGGQGQSPTNGSGGTPQAGPGGSGGPAQPGGASTSSRNRPNNSGNTPPPGGVANQPAGAIPFSSRGGGKHTGPNEQNLPGSWQKTPRGPRSSPQRLTPRQIAPAPMPRPAGRPARPLPGSFSPSKSAGSPPNKTP
jgi:hypothetical protein